MEFGSGVVLYCDHQGATTFIISLLRVWLRHIDYCAVVDID